MTDSVDEGAQAMPLSPVSPVAPHSAPAPAITAVEGAQLQPASPAVQVGSLTRDFGSPRAPIRAVDNLDL